MVIRVQVATDVTTSLLQKNKSWWAVFIGSTMQEGQMSLVHHFKLNFAELVFHKAKQKHRQYAKISAIIDKSRDYSFQKPLADNLAV